MRRAKYIPTSVRPSFINLDLFLLKYSKTLSLPTHSLAAQLLFGPIGGSYANFGVAENCARTLVTGSHKVVFLASSKYWDKTAHAKWPAESVATAAILSYSACAPNSAARRMFVKSNLIHFYCGYHRNRKKVHQSHCITVGVGFFYYFRFHYLRKPSLVVITTYQLW